ncbi:PilZ domain-containing protein [Stutzerimonas stutzeri]|uniref:PilZ domain-containing protein n=1 Tax=Stutzerimonas stutzeri TaxID=316 RepID=UPI00210A384B|nr:PilZ domain-containing protein [Stutzerimonas stutzeri]MCQ4321514.1 PilZ domain-containing protein [Stutzerimonas stutzeri]
MRQHSRLTFRHLGRIQVTNRLGGDPMGQVADLSKGGLRLVAKQPLGVNGCYEMCLHVPTVADRSREAQIVVLCQWVRKDARRDSFKMGFPLDRPSEDYTRLIGGLMPKRRD